jgi:hypothetical protein
VEKPNFFLSFLSRFCIAEVKLQQGCISNHNQESEQLLKCGKRGGQRVGARRDIDHMMLSRRVSTKIDTNQTAMQPPTIFWTELVLSFYEDSHPKSLSIRLFCLLRTLVCPNDLVPVARRAQARAT